MTKDELHRRLAAIANHHNVTFKELIEGGLRVLCLLGQDATLCALTKSGKVEVTDLYRSLYEEAGDIKPANISIDTLTRASRATKSIASRFMPSRCICRRWRWWPTAPLRS